MNDKQTFYVIICIKHSKTELKQMTTHFRYQQRQRNRIYTHKTFPSR